MSGMADVTLVFRPDGTRESTVIRPPFAGTSTGLCLESLVANARIDPFTGGPYVWRQGVVVH